MDVNSTSLKLEFQNPFARNALPIDLWWLECPPPGRLPDTVREILAWSSGNEAGYRHIAGRIHPNFHSHLQLPVNSSQSAAGYFRQNLLGHSPLSARGTGGAVVLRRARAGCGVRRVRASSRGWADRGWLSRSRALLRRGLSRGRLARNGRLCPSSRMPMD